MGVTRVSTILKWVSGGLEAFLGIPIVGGLIIFSSAWTPLFVMLVLHIVTLIFSINERTNRHGSILGIVTSCVGVIPIVGMIMHIITGVVLMVDAYRYSEGERM
ncbi:hypothetical protein [Rubeoparvulum massiliense]|uniref:hypothetical protein n=1 Tax=Rubeoparvulum massiliense TaxID=1631346 RepID=UPI00065E63C8|nr:hypothetical protein [Rubeoparvulum massiliense]